MALTSLSSAGDPGAQAASPAQEFQNFLKDEIAYHKAMTQMYEALLANELLGLNNSAAGEMLRTILIAGLHQLAEGHKR